MNNPKHASGLTIRKARTTDSEAIASIYNFYVKNTIITFEEEQVSPTEISKRIDLVFSDALPWLVAEIEASVVGYAYAVKWRARSAYRFSVESSLYVEPSLVRKRIGNRLYAKLFELLKPIHIHAVMAGISLPNPASIAFHELFGFVKTAHLKEVGIKFNQWIDVGYWQLIL